MDSRSILQKQKPLGKRQKSEDPVAVRRFLGMVNYLASFVPDMSQLSAPLRELTESKNWQWKEVHTQAFETVKSSITVAATQKYFNPQLPITAQCDASSQVLGAVIMLDKRPLAFAS